jgi:hypothetical protein
MDRLKGAIIMLKRAIVLGSLLALITLTLTPQAPADEISDLQAELNRLTARLEKMESEDTGRIRKEELAQMMKEILDDAKVAPALPEWMKNLKFYGLFRLRFESLTYDGKRGGGVGTPKNTNRIRMLLLTGFTKTWWDGQMEVGFELSSGPNAAPNAAHQTMTGDFDKKNIWISMMYAKYMPKWAEGLTIAGGKLRAPFRTKTPLTWSACCNPEGLYVDYRAPFFGDFKPYGQIGFWMVNENGQRDSAGAGVTAIRDTEMLSYSAGFDWKIAQAVDWFFGATYYRYYNADCSTGGWIGRWGADGQWAQAVGGVAVNGGLPSADFGILELTTKVGWTLDFLPTPLQKWEAWFTYLRNCKDDYSARKNAPPAMGSALGADRHFQNDNNGYGMGIKVGENKKKNDFSLAYMYFYLEYSSTVSGFIDPDLLYPNNQGHIINAIYNIDDFLTISGTVAFEQPIHTNDNPANAYNGQYWQGGRLFPHSEDMTCLFRVDLTWRF